MGRGTKRKLKKNTKTRIHGMMPAYGKNVRRYGLVGHYPMPENTVSKQMQELNTIEQAFAQHRAHAAFGNIYNQVAGGTFTHLTAEHQKRVAEEKVALDKEQLELRQKEELAQQRLKYAKQKERIEKDTERLKMELEPLIKGTGLRKDGKIDSYKDYVNQLEAEQRIVKDRVDQSNKVRRLYDETKQMEVQHRTNLDHLANPLGIILSEEDYANTGKLTELDAKIKILHKDLRAQLEQFETTIKQIREYETAHAQIKTLREEIRGIGERLCPDKVDRITKLEQRYKGLDFVAQVNGLITRGNGDVNKIKAALDDLRTDMEERESLQREFNKQHEEQHNRLKAALKGIVPSTDPYYEKIEYNHYTENLKKFRDIFFYNFQRNDAYVDAIDEIVKIVNERHPAEAEHLEPVWETYELVKDSLERFEDAKAQFHGTRTKLIQIPIPRFVTEPPKDDEEPEDEYINQY